jgi:hypothetical protein
MYNGVAPQMVGAQTGFLPPSFMPQAATNTAQVVSGPPSEIYLHGKVYKASDEPLAKLPEVGSTAAPTNKPLGDELRKHVEQKVAEFMSKDSLASGASTPTTAAAPAKVGAAVGSSGDSTQELFLKEIRKLNNQMKKQAAKQQR